MPPFAASKRPLRCFLASVKAPFSWPKSSASRSGSGIAAQFTLMNGPLARGEPWWMSSATSSLPVPDSPRMRIVASEPAAVRASSSMSVKIEERPTIRSSSVRSATWALSSLFSRLRRRNSRALSTSTASSEASTGFVR